MLYCYGEHCPLRNDCYRHTQPSRGRDRFGEVPYDTLTQTCEYFVTNEPSAELIQLTAYFMWQRAGCPAGQADAHWHAAYASLCQSTGKIRG